MSPAEARIRLAATDLLSLFFTLSGGLAVALRPLASTVSGSAFVRDGDFVANPSLSQELLSSIHLPFLMLLYAVFSLWLVVSFLVGRAKITSNQGWGTLEFPYLSRKDSEAVSSLGGVREEWRHLKASLKAMTSEEPEEEPFDEEAFRKNLSERFVKARQASAYTQQHLADAADVSLRTVQRLEKSGRASYETLRALGAVLNMEAISLERSEVKAARPLYLWRILLDTMTAPLFSLFLLRTHYTRTDNLIWAAGVGAILLADIALFSTRTVPLFYNHADWTQVLPWNPAVTTAASAQTEVAFGMTFLMAFLSALVILPRFVKVFLRRPDNAVSFGAGVLATVSAGLPLALYGIFSFSAANVATHDGMAVSMRLAEYGKTQALSTWLPENQKKCLAEFNNVELLASVSHDRTPLTMDQKHLAQVFYADMLKRQTAVKAIPALNHPKTVSIEELHHLADDCSMMLTTNNPAR